MEAWRRLGRNGRQCRFVQRRRGLVELGAPCPSVQVGRKGQRGRDPWEVGNIVTEKTRRKGCDCIMALTLTSWVAFGKWLNLSVSTDSPVN